MKILMWHLHGGYTDSLVRGEHEYLLPVDEARSEWGRGKAGRDWPRAREVTADELMDEEIDVVVLQRPDEVDVVHRFTGRRPGQEVAAAYVEHDPPREGPTTSEHPIADRDDILLVHLTHFNRLFWDNGRAPTAVIEHGVPDPGELYTGELPRAASVLTEPMRRWRLAGTDLLPEFAKTAPIDVYGPGGEALRRTLPPTGIHHGGELAAAELRAEIARRRLYLHTARWTSLGVSLIEAMLVGLPVVAIGATDAARAIPPGAGVVSTDLDVLADGIRELIEDPMLAREKGARARAHALEHYSLDRFLREWDEAFALAEEVRQRSAPTFLDEFPG